MILPPHIGQLKPFACSYLNDAGLRMGITLWATSEEIILSAQHPLHDLRVDGVLIATYTLGDHDGY